MTITDHTLLGARRVRKLHLELLFACNFRCRTCYHGIDLDRPDTIAPAHAMACLDYFATIFGCREACFLGGEPLLYESLPELLDRAQIRGFLTEICSNGYKQRIRLRECLPHLNRLRISLDGNEHVHDQIRRPHSFAAALETIAWAVAHGLLVGVTCTLTADNINTVPDLARRLREFGVDQLTFHRVRLVGNATRFNISGVTWEQARRLHDQLVTMNLGGMEINTRILLPERHRGNTDDVIDMLEIAPDGRVYPSCADVGGPGTGLRYDFDQARLVAEESARPGAPDAGRR